jgi:tRNA (guanosine-2'-O-)-methyltransferase
MTSAEPAEHPGSAPIDGGRQLDSTDLKRLHRTWRKKTARRIDVLLDGLGNPLNVGSIVRTCAAYGIDALWCCGPTPEISSSGVQKTAMGTDRYLEVFDADTTMAAIDEAISDELFVVALELTHTAVPIWELPADRSIALVVGHEDHGVGKATLARCEASAYLPLVGKVGSLNVAASVAAALAELRRAEWTA